GGGSIAISVKAIAPTRLASASPAAPTPAPNSTTRSPALAAVAAASSIASWPARWPLAGWRRHNCPPRKASSVMSASASLIGPQFMRQSGLAEELPRRLVVFLVHENPPRQDAERALDDAHVLVQHQMMDVGAIEQRADRRHQHHIVGPHQFPQLAALLSPRPKSRASVYLPLH